MPISAPGLSARQIAVVVAGVQPGEPGLGEVGLHAQRRHRGVGHRDRAGVARLDLGEQHESGRAGHVRAGFRVGPRAGVHPVGDGLADDPMVGGVVAHLVDAVAVPVVSGQGGHVGVRGFGRVAGTPRCRPARRSAPGRPGPSRRRSGCTASTSGMLVENSLISTRRGAWFTTVCVSMRNLHGSNCLRFHPRRSLGGCGEFGALSGWRCWKLRTVGLPELVVPARAVPQRDPK